MSKPATPLSRTLLMVQELPMEKSKSDNSTVSNAWSQTPREARRGRLEEVPSVASHAAGFAEAWWLAMQCH